MRTLWCQIRLFFVQIAVVSRRIERKAPAYEILGIEYQLTAHTYVEHRSQLLAGFLVLTTRRKAISQVTGYLMLENGIYVFGLLLYQSMAVEVGVLLDLVVGIFVMGIVLNHIQREFSSLDTERLSRLRE